MKPLGGNNYDFEELREYEKFLKDNKTIPKSQLKFKSEAYEIFKVLIKLH